MKGSRLPALTAVMLAFATSLSQPAEAIVYEQWNNWITGPGHSTKPPYGLGVDSLGNVYICGSMWRIGGQEFYFSKFNPGGDRLRTTHIDITGNIYEHPPCMAVDRSGNTYLGADTSSGPGISDYLTIRVNASGQVMWTATYNGPAGGADFIMAIAVDQPGNVYVTGYSATQSAWNYTTIKYNAQGIQQWVAPYPGTGYYLNAKIVVDAEGYSYVTYRDGNRCHTVKYNSQGVQQWTAVYDPGLTCWGNDIALDHQGNVYVTGASQPPANSDAFIIKYNPSGIQQWIATYGVTQQYEYGTNIEIDQNDNVIVEIGTSSILKTMKYNSDGHLLWSRNNGSDEPHAGDRLALDLEGCIYVAGTTLAELDNTACATYKYNPGGDLQWVAIYDTSCWVEANWHIALDESRNIIVAGWWCWPDYLFSDL